MKSLIKTMVFLLTVTMALVAQAGGQMTFTVNGVSFTMVPIEGGTFTMGATTEQGSDYDSDELPTHQVTLSDFMICQTEVTEALWIAVMGNNPSANKKGDNYPIENVTWNACQEFIARLNTLTGATFRLPTEAEWEFAARGGNKSKGYKYAGSNTLGDVAWCKSNSGNAKQPVGTKLPNELGIYDMSGSVWEWCQDWKGYYSSDAQKNPTGPASGSKRIFRGGSWSNPDYECRVSERNEQTVTVSFNDIGLRLAMGSTNKTYTVNGVSFTMVPVEGGTFTMGATSEQGSDALDSEFPTHQVTLGNFMIGQTEVTEGLWKAVMGSNPSENKRGDNYPVEYVSWDACQQFVAKLNEMTGQNFRLPTEAEWEFAARGGNKSKGYKYAGSDNIADVAWYSSSAKHEVSTKAPNELGLYDMSGNVWELCHDWYDSFSNDAQTNPTGPTSGSYHVARGGGWWNEAWLCRVSFRSKNTPSDKYNDLGLRLAMSTSSNPTNPSAGVVTVGSGGVLSEGNPICNWEMNTYQGSEEIYLKNELGLRPGDIITALSYHCIQGSAPGGTFNVRIKNTTLDKLADVNGNGDASMVKISFDDKVYGTITLGAYSQGDWITFPLSEPFVYDGNNIIIDIRNTKPGSCTGGCYFDGWECDGNRSLTWVGANSEAAVSSLRDLWVGPFMPHLRVSYTTTGEEIGSGVVTVGSGGVLSEGNPICNWWMQTYQGSELIYKKNELGLRPGDIITALSYHCIQGSAPGGTFNVRIRNTALDKFADVNGNGDASMVKISYDDKVYGTVTLGAYGQGDWITFPLSEPFVYDGNNIIIDIRNTKPGSRTGWCYFDGWESDGNRGILWVGANSEAAASSFTDLWVGPFLPQMRVSYTTKGEEIVQATSLSLNESEVTLSVNETVRLAATIEPDDVTNSTLSWLSDNPSVATVDAAGNVKALKSGIATITAKTTDGSNLSASCRITVVKDYLISATMLQHLRGEPEAVVELPISLDNRTAVAQMQFDITLPEAVTIAGDYDAATGLTFYDDCIRLDDARKSRSHYGEVTKLSGANTYRVLIGTTQGNTTLKGNHGVVAYLTLHLAQYHDAGDFDILFSNIIMTGTDQADQHTADNATSLVRLEYMLGDANADVAVDVADYQVTARHILTLSTPRFYADAANVYAADGAINVSDLQGIVNIISGINSTTIKHAPKRQASAGLALVPRMTGDGAVAIALTGGVPIGALQMDLTLPQGATLVGAEMASGGSHQVDYATLPDGKVRLLVSSPDGATLEPGDEPFLMLTLDGAHGGIAMLDEAIAVETDLTTYRLNNATFELTLTGIDSPMAELASIRVVNNVLVIDSPTDGTAQLVRVNGVATPMDVKAGRNKFVLGQGVYAVRLGGAAAKIIIR